MGLSFSSKIPPGYDRKGNQEKRRSFKFSTFFRRKKKLKIKTRDDLNQFIEANGKGSTVASSLDDRYPPLPPRRAENILETEETDGGTVEYFIEHKGPVFIINNFAGNDDFSFRHGSFNDVAKIKNVFEKLGFFVHCENNLKCDEMVEVCKKWAWRNYSNADCLVVFILTHGKSPDSLAGIDEKYIPFDQLISPFLQNNPLLFGKPKIFFVQACRGHQINKGLREPNSVCEDGCKRVDNENFDSSSSNTSVLEALSDFRPPREFSQALKPSISSSGFLPRQADWLIAFATVAGYQAYRENGENNLGSWYVDELTKTLEDEYLQPGKSMPSRKHLHDVLTEVQGRVSNRVANVHDTNTVQMPELRSTLRGPIYLFNSSDLRLRSTGFHGRR